MGIALLLTASIHVNKGIPYLSLEDSNTRREQYEEALTFYLENTHYKVVFVENTGTNISNVFFNRYIEKGRLEILSFAGNDFPKELGKGYGEAVILEYAIAHSSILVESEYILKITGRLKIYNIEVLIRECNSTMRKGAMVGADSSLKGAWTTSYFFVAHKEFFSPQFIKQLKGNINDTKKVCFENVLSDLIQDWRKSGKYFHEFYNPIIVDGVCAGSGQKYPSGSINDYMKALLKGVLINLFKRK